MIGVFYVMGIVKNSIILVWTGGAAATGDMRTTHGDRDAGARARPIVMTSVATMMSAIPTALGLNSGASIAAIADAVLGGLIIWR